MGRAFRGSFPAPVRRGATGALDALARLRRRRVLLFFGRSSAVAQPVLPACRGIAPAFPPPAPGPLAAAVRKAMLGRPGPRIPVETSACTRSRVRAVPTLAAAAAMLLLAVDSAGSLYLREVMGVRLFDAHRAALLPPSRTVVVDARGRPVGTLAAPDAVRDLVDEVPQVFRDALVRWEDARFFSHDGVDRYRMFGAVAALLRGDAQGGSTLTMQLAKLVKRDSARTVRRKLEDIALALEMDRRLGKAGVLRAYANQAYFGAGVYGIGQACRYYFDRERCEGLLPQEAAYLVALLRAPADLSREEARARGRRNAVLEALREPLPPPADVPWPRRLARTAILDAHRLWDHVVAGRLDVTGRYPDRLVRAAQKTPLQLVRRSVPAAWPFVLETARQDLEKRLGGALYADGLRVRLTVDAPVQAAAERALAEGLGRLRSLLANGEAPPDSVSDDLDGAVVVVDPRTGRMPAFVPGADFRSSQVPFAERPIQIGSSVKPFLYAELFEEGLADLSTTVRDGPICFGKWCPKNYDGRFHGDVPVWVALSRSLNTVAVRVADRVGVDSLVARLRLLGARSPLAANLPMALGASELTLTELAGLYATLWDGRVVQPKLVLDATGRDGAVLLGGDEPLRPRALGPATVERLHAAMAQVLGPGGTAASLGRELDAYFLVPGATRGGPPGAAPQIACKTGTHDSFTRVGMGCLLSDSDFGPLAIVAYVGYRTPRPLGEGLTGARVAGPILSSLIRSVTAGTRAAGVFRPFPGAAGLPDFPANTDTCKAGGDRAQRAPCLPGRSSGDAALLQAFDARDAADPPGAAFALARASMAAPAPEPPAPHGEADDGASVEAPRDWAGLRVLDADVVEATGPALVRSFVDAGGREEDLLEIAPLLGMTAERRVVHAQRLLEGFRDRPIADRAWMLGERVTASLSRMLDEGRSVRRYELADESTQVVADVDGDRRVERVYRFERPLRMLRVTRHRSTSRVLAVELTEADGTRRGFVRRGERLAALSLRRVAVGRGSLEPAWVAAGFGGAQLDGLRSMLGATIDIDRIPSGFSLDVMLADGAIVRAEAYSPARDRRTPARHDGATLVEGACLGDDGVPCSRRMLPLPLGEARLYSRRGSVRDGPVLVQRAGAGSAAVAPLRARVEAADPDRGRVVLAAPDGLRVRLEGLRPAVGAGSTVQAGAVVGRLDARETLVVQVDAPDRDSRVLRPRSVLAALPEAVSADAQLRAAASWWNELHLWLRGLRPEHRRPAVAAAPSPAAQL